MFGQNHASLGNLLTEEVLHFKLHHYHYVEQTTQYKFTIYQLDTGAQQNHGNVISLQVVTVAMRFQLYYVTTQRLVGRRHRLYAVILQQQQQYIISVMLHTAMTAAIYHITCCEGIHCVILSVTGSNTLMAYKIYSQPSLIIDHSNYNN